MRPPLLVPLLLSVVLAGCAANQAWNNATPEQRRGMFEAHWNGQVGKSFDVHGLYKGAVVSVAELGSGKREYVVKQLRECRIALVVQTEGSVVLSWRYASEQAKCSAYYYATGA